MVQYTLERQAQQKAESFPSLCRLLINSYREENSLRIPLLHICVISYLQIILLCCSADQRLQLCPYFPIALASSACHTKVQRRAVLFDQVSTHYHHLSISARRRTHSKYARSHNQHRRLCQKTICLCFPMSQHPLRAYAPSLQIQILTNNLPNAN